MLEKLTILEKKVETAVSLLKEERAKAKSLVEENLALKEQIADEKQKYAKLAEEYTNYKVSQKGLQSEIETLKEKIESMLADLKDIPSEEKEGPISQEDFDAAYNQGLEQQAHSQDTTISSEEIQETSSSESDVVETSKDENIPEEFLDEEDDDEEESEDDEEESEEEYIEEESEENLTQTGNSDIDDIDFGDLAEDNEEDKDEDENSLFDSEPTIPSEDDLI